MPRAKATAFLWLGSILVIFTWYCLPVGAIMTFGNSGDGGGCGFIIGIIMIIFHIASFAVLRNYEKEVEKAFE